MDHSEIESRVRQIIADVLKLDPSEITKNSNFIFDLGADSAQSIELVAALEEGFDIEMDEDQALAVQNVGEAADFIDTLVNG